MHEPNKQSLSFSLDLGNLHTDTSEIGIRMPLIKDSYCGPVPLESTPLLGEIGRVPEVHVLAHATCTQGILILL